MTIDVEPPDKTVKSASRNANKERFLGKQIALIGYGVTGQSCADYLLNLGANLTVFDQVLQSDVVASLNQRFPEAQVSFYQLNSSIDLSGFSLVVVSPGVNLSQSYIQAYVQQHGKESVVGDIELFAQDLNARKQTNTSQTKVVAITGSNGKSTVVDMLGKVLTAMNVNVAVGGNFGVGALSLLNSDYEVIVLELSSFQLESTYTLCPDIACVMNVSSDHLDRHGTLEQYAKAKRNIYRNAKHILYNQNDELTHPVKDELSLIQTNFASFSEYGASKQDNKQKDLLWWTQASGIFRNAKEIVSHKQLEGLSDINKQNAMISLACIDLLELPLDDALASLATYNGLAHRFETVYKSENCIWINDSKATNPGAAQAAITSIQSKINHLILIAGGDAKGADLHGLLESINKYAHHLVLLGEDRHKFTNTNIPCTLVDNMQQAVSAATSLVNDYLQANPSGKVAVLLSPACASIDMFTNYQARGNEFCKAVKEQVAA